MNKLLCCPIEKYITFKNVFNLFFLVIAAFFVLSTCYASYTQFSSIPFWDTWSGYFDFIFKENKTFFDFFSQHNEHRIFLARLFFYIDYYLFGAGLYFLIAMNLFFQASLAFIFYFIISKALGTKQYSCLVICISCILGFTFIQYENITWEFQSQFYLVSLLPLLSLLALFQYSEHKVQNHKKASIYFITSFCLTVLSCVTMANGIFIFILYFLALIYLKIDKKIIIPITFTLIFIAVLYFLNFSIPNGHFTLSSTLFGNPKNFFLYLYLFIANPIQYVLNTTAISIVFGFFTIVFCSVQIVNVCNNLEKFKRFSVFLLLFIVFSLLSALAIASGRAGFGELQAFSSRYSTPVLVFFAVLFAYILSVINKNHEKILCTVAISLCFLFFPYQLDATLHGQSKHLNKVAGLAATFDINDPSSNVLYPYIPTSYGVTKQLVAQEKGFVTKFPYSYVYQNSSEWKLPENASPISGQIDQVGMLENENEFVKVIGWAYDASNKKTPEVILLTNQDKIIGFAFTGEFRQDVADSLKIQDKYTGFVGYILNPNQEEISYNLYTAY